MIPKRTVNRRTEIMANSTAAAPSSFFSRFQNISIRPLGKSWDCSVFAGPSVPAGSRTERPARPLWRSLTSGAGVCDAVVRLAVGRAGVRSQLVDREGNNRRDQRQHQGVLDCGRAALVAELAPPRLRANEETKQHVSPPPEAVVCHRGGHD